MRGWGFIRAENGKDIFVSSYDIAEIDKKVIVGSILRFIPKEYNNKICAKDIEVVSSKPQGAKFELPNGMKIPCHKIECFGYEEH